MEPEKKISFGFSKISKKPSLLLNKSADEKKVELIDCLEGQSIKVKDAVEFVNEPLIIPIKGNKDGLVDRIRDAAKSREKNDVKKEEDTRPDSELTIDELAARELLKDAQNRLLNLQSDNKIFVIPKKEEKIELEGESESTLEDYEKVPINDFGLAVLRGMGWKEGSGIGKNPTKASLASAPELRPKGLGLGANKLVKTGASKDSTDTNGKEIIIKKGAFVKIIAGTHKSYYGEVLGLDDEAARVIVKTTIKGEILTLNEFLVNPVTKEEYSRYSKILNTARYEEYKEKEASDNMKHDSALPDNSESNKNRKKYSSHSRANSQNNERRKLDTYEKDSRSSLGYSEKHEREYERSSKQHNSSDSSSLENEKLSSKVHKRKDKRRHRDKSRSPHRKHNKYGNNRKYSKSKYRSSSSSDSEYEKKKKNKKYRSPSRSSSSESEYERRKEKNRHRKEDRWTKHSR